MRKRLLILFVAFDTLLVLLYLGASWYFADVLLAAPTQDLAASRAILSSERMPAWAPGESVPIDVTSGELTLAGEFYDNPENGACAVLLLHGYSGTRYNALQYAPMFWARGCDVLAYDARGHGASSEALHTYGFFEKEDAVVMFDWLAAETGLAPAAIGLVGVSYGAATALQLLFLRDDMAFIIADSPYQDLLTIVSYQSEAQFGSWVRLFVPGATVVAEMRADFEADDVSPLDAVIGQAVPILLTHSLQDTFTPPTHSEAIYTAANPDNTDLVLTDWGAPHAQAVFEDYSAFTAFVDTFLAEQAPDFGAGLE